MQRSSGKWRSPGQRRTAVAALVSVSVVAPAAACAATLGHRAPPQPRPAPAAVAYYVSAADVARIRRNIAKYTWAKIAWQKTKGFADARIGVGSQPPDPNADYSTTWRDGVYLPGLADGMNARILALAYKVSGDRRYAETAKGILMNWVRVYSHPPGSGGGVVPGHMVAEPIGPMIKLFMAADMLRSYLSPRDWAMVSAWARQWIAVGERNADGARDFPWTPDMTVGSFVSNPASYGNSPMGQRAMAVWAAAVAGRADLRAALDWNWSHQTPGGKDYGWNDVIEKLFITGSGGETVEGRLRQSVGYGLFAWSELLLVADVARHAGFARNLFIAQTATGKSLLSAAVFYAPLLTGAKPYPYASASETFGDRNYDTQRSEFRAVFETAYANCPKSSPAYRWLQSAVSVGGDAVRGTNFDNHVTAWNALLAAGP